MNEMPAFVWRSIVLAGIVALLGFLAFQFRFWGHIDSVGSFLPTQAFARGQGWTLEVANSDPLRVRGLGGRAGLDSEAGMLFLFETIGRHGFWMEGMQFPLDMVFLSRGRVVFIERGIRPDDTRVILPPVPIDQVLEVNAGEARDLLPGDRVWYWHSPF